VFNIARNLGGSVGTAVLDTVITRREQFHDFEIGPYINAYRPVVQDRLNNLSVAFVNKGHDAVIATQQAYGQLKNIVRREAYVMAFNDAFLIVGISLLIAAVLVWLCQKDHSKTRHGGALEKPQRTFAQFGEDFSRRGRGVTQSFKFIFVLPSA
jgi:DHA2 family multidrug resistance protein